MVCLDAKVIIIWAVIIRLSSRCLSLCFPMTHSPVSGRILPLSLWSLSGMLPNSMGVHLICSFPAYIKSYILPWHPASRGQYYSSYQTETWPQNCHVLHSGPGSAMLTPFYFFPHILYTPMYFKNFVSIFLCQNLSLKLRGTFLSKCGLRIISQLVGRVISRVFVLFRGSAPSGELYFPSPKSGAQQQAVCFSSDYHLMKWPYCELSHWSRSKSFLSLLGHHQQLLFTRGFLLIIALCALTLCFPSPLLICKCFAEIRSPIFSCF